MKSVAIGIGLNAKRDTAAVCACAEVEDSNVPIPITAAPDPNWESLLITPPHPEFPSAHCMTTGAVAQVLRDVIGSDEVKVGYVYPPGLGMMRNYTSLMQLEKEVEDARVFAGIHFRSTDQSSTELGRRVGTDAVAQHLRPVAASRASR